MLSGACSSKRRLELPKRRIESTPDQSDALHQCTVGNIFNFNEEEKDDGKGYFKEHMPKDSILYQALKTVLKARNAKPANPNTYESPEQLKEPAYGCSPS